MKICDRDSCTGCMACASVCSKNAIKAVEDSHGFTHPVVDSDRCINCGSCVKVCPTNTQPKYKKTEEVYACWQLNKKKRFDATSGGVFMTIAEEFIASGGVVYGASFDENFVVRHTRIKSLENLKKVRGSKYVQSVTYGIFETVKSDLLTGTRVLFSGTPCQVAALKNYLGKEYKELYTIDIVCHGVPSPKVFREYLSNIKDKYRQNIASINFRWKRPSWSVFSMRICFTNGEEYRANKFKDPFLYFFLAGGGDLTLRRSCFQCRFTSPERVGDITLGDFWGIRAEHFVQRGIEKGVGLVLVNSSKGSELFKEAQTQLYVERRDWYDANCSNRSFSSAWSKPLRFDEFWEFYNENGFEKSQKKFCDQIIAKTEMKLRAKGAFKRAHAYFIPYPIRSILKTIKAKIKRRLGK